MDKSDIKSKEEEKNYFENRTSYGNLSKISDAFQKCYLDDRNTENYFLKVINESNSDYSRYVFFYVSYENWDNLSNQVSRSNKIYNSIILCSPHQFF